VKINKKSSCCWDRRSYCVQRIKWWSHR